MLSFRSVQFLEDFASGFDYATLAAAEVRIPGVALRAAGFNFRVDAAWLLQGTCSADLTRCTDHFDMWPLDLDDNRAGLHGSAKISVLFYRSSLDHAALRELLQHLTGLFPTRFPGLCACLLISFGRGRNEASSFRQFPHINAKLRIRTVYRPLRFECQGHGYAGSSLLPRQRRVLDSGRDCRELLLRLAGDALPVVALLDYSSILPV